jgi:hypothetical protein
MLSGSKMDRHIELRSLQFHKIKSYAKKMNDFVAQMNDFSLVFDWADGGAEVII